MKAIFYKILWLLLTAMMITSCSRDNESREMEYNRYLKMEINGAEWEADDSFDLKFMERGLGVDENADSYTLLLIAMQPGKRETFSIMLYLPLDKLDNPVGDYPIISDITQLGAPGTAEIYYYNNTDPATVFSSRTGSKESPDGGTLTITDFEKGDGAFAQGHINRLEGTFSVVLKAMEQEYKTSETIVITAATFDIANALYDF